MTAQAGDRRGDTPAPARAGDVSSWAAIWWLAARPRTLFLSATPVVAGTFWAMETGPSWRPAVLAMAMIAALAIQVGTNLWNDAADFMSGVDGGARIGPTRVTASGLASPRSVRFAALLCFAIAVAAGSILVWIGGWTIVAIGLASLVAGYAYSMGPYPLSRTPLGEVIVILFFGVAAVAGTYFLHTGTADGKVLLLGAIMGLPAAAVLLVNNHRDRASDAVAGRRTLAILIGVANTRILFGLLLAAAFAGVLSFAGSPIEFVLCLPLAMVFALLARDMWRLPISAALNGVLARTSLSQVVLLLTIVALTAFHI